MVKKLFTNAKTEEGLNTAINGETMDAHIAFIEEPGNEGIYAKGKIYQTVPSNGKDGQALLSQNGKGVWADINVLDLLSYGVEWKPNVADPALMRVGNMDYHKTLPIQNNMKGCILNPKTKKVVYWLDESDWNYKKERYTAKKLSVAENNDTGNMLVTLQLTAEIVKSFENSGTIKVIHPEISQPYEHRIISRTENTITYDDDTIDGGVNSSYTIFVAARLDGYDGEVFVYVPEFWIKSWDEPDRRCVRISPTKIDDSWEHQPAIFVSAYKNTVLTTVPENMGYLSTLKINSAISVANNATYCRGGDTNTTYDTHKDIFKGTLGKPRTAINRPTFRGYARQAGKEIMSYKQYKNIMYWLYVIEYANFNSQAEFNSELTSEGFHQGGLGNGITNVSKHYDYNNNNPICINGYTNQFGNGTNIKVIESTYLAPVNNVYAIRWRGIENPFGDTSTIVDGVLVDNSFSHDVHVYVTDDPNKYGDTAQSRNNMILLSTIKLRKSAFIKEFNLGTTAEIILRSFGGDATSYKCDYFDSTSFGLDTCLLVWQGSSGGGGLCGGSLMTSADNAYVDQSYRTVIIA